MKIERKPIFKAVRDIRGGQGFTVPEVGILDAGIDEALSTIQLDEGAIAEVLRHLFGPLNQAQWDAVRAALHGDPLPDPSPDGISQIGIPASAFISAAARLGCSVAQIRAVDEVESGGGWFTDVRAEILALDGPGGFLDGPNLPKILFEAHHFSRLTDHRFDASHPNVSSARWNKALYVGGQGEYRRLEQAMLLDREVALQSASVGRYQIMGFNFKAAGFATVDAFWDAMKTSEVAQLQAFVSFVIHEGLSDELRAVSSSSASCVPFTKRYNGPGQVAVYSARLAAAFVKWSK
jgi:hypothetical protein